LWFGKKAEANRSSRSALDLSLVHAIWSRGELFDPIKNTTEENPRR
jgi:hypothetical protein